MSLLTSVKTGSGLAWGAGLLLWVSAASTARGQLYTTDPYDRTFRSFAYPSQADGFGPPVTAPRSRPGYVAPNQFDSMGDDLIFGGGGRTGRYDSAFRRFDQDFGRQYIPNEESDKRYMQERERRETDMIRAMRERDPKKRAELLRAAEKEMRKEAADVSLSVRRGSSGATIPRAPAGTRGTARARAAAGAGTGGTPTAVPPAPGRTSRGAATQPGGSGIKPAPAPTRTSPSAGRSIPPAPTSSNRARSSAGAAGPRPSDVLERSRERDRRDAAGAATRRLPEVPALPR